jgi:CHAT domain-containing protein/tetratricopeptide (TPR) repeat protein
MLVEFFGGTPISYGVPPKSTRSALRRFSNWGLGSLRQPILLAWCLLAFSHVGGAPEGPLAFPQVTTQSLALRESIRRGGELYRAGHYTEASQVFKSAFDRAESLSLRSLAGRALGNLGGCQFALHQYRAALHSFLQARIFSESAGDTDVAAAWDADIASLYFATGEFDAAAEWTTRSLRRMSGHLREQNLPKLQVQLATLQAVEGRMPEALALFQQGIAGADRLDDKDLYANGWNRLGEALLKQGDLAGAEAALLEAYCTRKLHHLELDTSYRSLGRLRLAQGDLESASALLDRAAELAAKPQGLTPTWDIYHSRALVRIAQGRLPEALSDLRIALWLGRAWRWASSANETTQIGAEAMLDQVHSALVDVGNRLYLETRDPALIRETFAANEENRAASLRNVLWDASKAGGKANASPELPAAYWEALARLQRAEVAALRGGDSVDLAAARAELVRMEAAIAGEPRPLPENLTEAGRALLGPGEVLFSFHLGTERSWVWALDRRGLELYPLPGRAAVENLAEKATAAIRGGQTNAEALSVEIYRTLFGGVGERFRSAARWFLALDGALAELPIAALLERQESGSVSAPEYLLARHTVELIPGVAYWVESGEGPARRLSPLFVGLGDPIYSRADQRLAAVSRPEPEELALPRLPGSGAEIETCARAWRGRSILLRGRDATREKLAEALVQRPAAVHLAAHYLESAGRNRYGLIALSLSPGGDSQVLTPFEISRWRIQAGLVVLSGCHSAAGAAIPGEGALGLPRAWLAAGAESVVGSLWNTPDDEGALFAELYRNLRDLGRLDAAQALRQAQLTMIRSGGRFGRPSYWGAYFVVANRGKGVLPR